MLTFNSHFTLGITVNVFCGMLFAMCISLVPHQQAIYRPLFIFNI